MINLLPEETKKQLKAARWNVILVRYIFVIVIAFGFITLVSYASSILLAQTRSSADSLIESTDTNAPEFAETQAQINELSTTLSGARTILDSRVSYAELLRTIGGQMPEGTVMRELEIPEAALNGQAVTVEILAETTEAAATLRERFQSNPRFQSVNLESISETGGETGYPVTATLSFTITRGAN